MAGRLRAKQLTQPDARLIVLTGNYHARMSPPENLLTSTGKPFADPPTPMAMHLADITGMSIDISAYGGMARSEEHTSELQSLMRISYAVFCLKKKITIMTATCTHKRMHTTH